MCDDMKMGWLVFVVCTSSLSAVVVASFVVATCVVAVVS